MTDTDDEGFTVSCPACAHDTGWTVTQNADGTVSASPVANGCVLCQSIGPTA